MNDDTVPAGLEARRPLRVLYVDYSVGFGGATKSISLVFQALPDVEKYVLTSQRRSIIADWYPGATVLRFRSLLNYRTYTTVRAWTARTLRLGLARLIAQKALAAVDVTVSAYHSLRILWLVRRHRIDLIHLNNGFTPLEGLIASRLAGVPCIVHLRGFLGWRPPSHGPSHRRVSRALVVSNAVGTDLGFSCIPPARIVTVYDPVDLDRFAATAGQRDAVRAEWGIEPDDVAVGIFGRVVSWKGQLEFVRAALEAIRAEPRLKAVIVGDESDGVPEYFEDIRTIIRSSGLAHRFVLTGYQPHVAALYHAMDLIVHGSIEPEPFGMVVPEAMAARRPIIASDAGGPREVVTPGVDGILVRPGDVPAMARAMVELARDPARRRAMGERGYAKVVERFSIPRIAGEVRRVYDEIVS